MALVELPDGELGDILYHDGTGWVALSGIDGTTVLAGMSLYIDGTTLIPKWDYPRLVEE